TEIDPGSGDALYGVVHDENARFLQGVSGNAGIFSTIGDMARFAAMLACEGDGFLSKDTLEMAVVNRTKGYEDSRGLAFHLASPGSFFGDRFPESAFGHTGFTGTSLAVDGTTGFYVALLTNRVHPTRLNEAILPFRRVFHNRMYQAFALSGESPDDTLKEGSS
ncbi:MAG: serine hydrolase, partial [Clostridia bacterium]|nr:serine hydrolase [Clostridia bacterium]